MKKFLIAGTITGMAAIFSQQAVSDGFLDDVTWVPQLGFQMKQLKFDQEVQGGGFVHEKGGLDADLPTLSLSLTALYQKFYISLKYEDTISDTVADSDVPFTNSETKVDREDFSATVGFNIWKGANIFAGYMSGETTLEPTPVCPVTPPQPQDQPGFNCNDGDHNGNIAWDAQFWGDPTYKQIYEEDGWYLGGSYGWKIADTGTLSVSAAYASLDATYKDNWAIPFKSEGDADGVSFGINWSAPLTKRVGYYIDLRTQKYDMDTKNNSGSFQGAKVKTEETITAFTAGVQWYL